MDKFDYNEIHIARAKRNGLQCSPVSNAQVCVQEFMEAMGQHVGRYKPEPADLNLRRRLILEEADEFADAVDAGDFPKMVDALADILYVVYGAFVVFGVPAKAVFELVHDANMAKLGGPKDEHGKQLKPDGWVEPDVRGLLMAMGWEENN
jgi:predicted HAD superfamily Cof-like phosphohydrolase